MNEDASLKTIIATEKQKLLAENWKFLTRPWQEIEIKKWHRTKIKSIVGIEDV